QRPLGLRDPGTPVASLYREATAAVLLHRAHPHLAPLGVEQDVPRQLGNRGGDQRRGPGREAQLLGHEPPLLPRADDVAVALHRDPRLRGDRFAAHRRIAPSPRFSPRCSSASSRSSVVVTPSSVSPICTMANATSGWMPTITVRAPRRRIICAISLIIAVAK